MRWIYLSPHLDDAVFSVGGLIYEQVQTGLSVEIWTLMCGYPLEDEVSPFAQSLHAQWGFSSAAEAVRLRRAEDENAAASLGAHTFHLDFLDCIYRRGTDGQWLYSDVFVSPHPDDAGLPSRIARTVSARLSPDDVLACPLSLGSHVDHVLVRQGAELLERPLRLYIDVPYVFGRSEELASKAAGMVATLHAITETGLNRWTEAALSYESQISTLGESFNTPERVRQSLQAYWAQQGGVRLLHKG